MTVLHTGFRAASVCAVVCSVSAPAKTIIVNQANWTKAISAAAPGDKIVLSPGGYGVINVPRKNWLTPITIDASSAVMSGVVMLGVSGVTWIGGTVIGSIYGISIRNSSRISITGVDISLAQRGIVINSSDDIRIIKNRLHHLRTDGVDIVGQRVVVEGNIISNMLPVVGDHPDGIQMWSTADYKTRDVTVRANVVSGAMQGIYGSAPGVGLENIRVTGNKVTVTYGNGIVLGDATGTIATGNIVQSPTGAKNKANMRILGSYNLACGNTVPDVPQADAARPCD